MGIFRHLRFTKFFVEFCTEKSVLMRCIYWESVLKNNILLYAWKRSIITLDVNEREKSMQLADKLWREYEPYIRKLCNYKLNRHKEYIDDCVQDVFAALVEALHKGTQIEYPKTWLTTVANNMIKDIYEKAGHDDKILPFDENHIEVRFQDSIEYEELSEQDIDKYLSQIIDYLTEYERKLFIDFYLNNRKQSELAKERGISENLIQQQVFRLKRKIIKFIKHIFN